MNYETQEELEKGLEWWQDALRLRDWRLTAKLLSAVEFGDLEVRGSCNPTTRLKCAHLKLVRSEDAPADAICADMEETLVHELLHAHFDFLEPKPETLAYELWEQLIEQLSVAFVALKRMGGLNVATG